MPGTVTLHRVLRAKPERVYRAFLDAAALAKWLPPLRLHRHGPFVGRTCWWRVVQQSIPDMIPVEACYVGWQESLEQLVKLVEPEIPDGA